MERPSLYSVELRTADWLRLVDWYRDVVGLRVAVRMTKAQYALLVGGEGRLTILGRPESAELRESSPDSRWSIGFEATDLEATRERLTGSGIACPTGRRTARRLSRARDSRPRRQPCAFLRISAPDLISYAGHCPQAG